MRSRFIAIISVVLVAGVAVWTSMALRTEVGANSRVQAAQKYALMVAEKPPAGGSGVLKAPYPSLAIMEQAVGVADTKQDMVAIWYSHPADLDRQQWDEHLYPPVLRAEFGSDALLQRLTLYKVQPGRYGDYPGGPPIDYVLERK